MMTHGSGIHAEGSRGARGLAGLLERGGLFVQMIVQCYVVATWLWLVVMCSHANTVVGQPVPNQLHMEIITW